MPRKIVKIDTVLEKTKNKVFPIYLKELVQLLWLKRKPESVISLSTPQVKFQERYISSLYEQSYSRTESTVDNGHCRGKKFLK